MENKPRKTEYIDLELKDMIRTVSDNNTRVYFTDIDFLAYIYINGNRVPIAAIEGKRRYQIKDRKYKLVDSDKLVIDLASNLKVPFTFVFYNEGKLSDDDEVLIILVNSAIDEIDICNKNSKTYSVYHMKVIDYKNLLKCFAKTKKLNMPFSSCFTNISKYDCK